MTTPGSENELGFSHVSVSGDPVMVDVGAKDRTFRQARAQAEITMPSKILALLKNGELYVAKGPVFQTAITAGIMAVKRTSDLIPLCHPIGIDHCDVKIGITKTGGVIVTCNVAVEHKTGVEMEALTGVTIAALTVYDMCKSMSHEIIIREVRLLGKTGGKRDYTARVVSNE